MQVYYGEGYVAAAHPYETTRKSAQIAAAILGGRVPGVTIAEPSAFLDAAERGISVVHDAAYVRALRTGEPEWLAEGSGFDWDPGIWTMVRHSTAGILASVEEALARGLSGSLSSGLHHAKPGAGEGNCTVNGLVVAARHATNLVDGPIVILDVDAHCGGGTAQCLDGVTGVLHLDLSTSRFDEYEPTGDDCLVLVDRTDDDTYLEELDLMLARIPREASLVLVNAGMDPHPGIAVDTLAERERRIAAFMSKRGVPATFVLAGGYLHGITEAELVGLHLLTVSAFAEAEASREAMAIGCAV